MLPDREAQTLAAWLEAHPGVKVICRDRAGAYAEGARAGVPDAIEVADRWHLWHNLCEAVQRTVVHHRTCLPEPATAAHTNQQEEEKKPSPVPRPDSPAAIRMRERYAAVQEMLGKGLQRKVIASVLNLDPDTVARYADAACVEQLLVTRHSASKLDPFKDYLDIRWNEGCTDATRLAEELRELGYRGTSRTVRRYLEPIRAAGSPAAHTPTPPKPRQVTGWLTCHPDKVSDSKKLVLSLIL